MKDIFYKWVLLVVAAFAGYATKADIPRYEHTYRVDFLPPPRVDFFVPFDGSVLPEGWLLVVFLMCFAIVVMVSIRKKNPYAPAWIVFLSTFFLGLAMLCGLMDFGGIFLVGIIAWIIAIKRFVCRRRYAWAACTVGVVPCLLFAFVLLFSSSPCRGILQEARAFADALVQDCKRELGRKSAFEQWASDKVGDCLTAGEKKILFKWQFYVVEHERRPWKSLMRSLDDWRNKFAFRDYPNVQSGEVAAERRNGEVGLWQSTSYEQDFADFGLSGKSAVDFVEGWYDKAVAAGMKPDGEDEKLLAKARTSKMPWAGCANISIVRGFPHGKVRIAGDASLQDLKAASDNILNRLGVDEETLCIDEIELDKPENATLKNIFAAFPANQVLGIRMLGKAGSEVDMSELAKCTRVRELFFRDCVVDLSFVRNLSDLVSLDITGCQVKNFAALRGLANLTTLKMEHLKGGVESLSSLLDNPALRTVAYTKADLQPSAYMEFARACRIREHGDNLERILKEAVKDRDLPEIGRLCKDDIITDSALSEFSFSDELAIDALRLLAPKATEQCLAKCLERFCASLGYGYLSRRPSCVPTNSVEIVELLLKNGAWPSGAVSMMEHPAEEDLEIFRMMLASASYEARAELLQKNIKSFGNHDRFDGSVRRRADRLEVVRLLLESGADPNARNFFGKTSLGNAIEYDGDMRLVRLLLDKGADATLLYPKMEMFRGFYQGHGGNVWGTNRYELVELLLEHGFDVNAKGQFGKTPIGELVFFGGGREPYDLKMAKLLT